MKTFRLSLVLFIVSICNFTIFADSPITSTPFSSVYSEEKIIVSAAKAKGIITEDLMEYLSKTDNPIELKMALINKLGWHNKIKDNNQIYYRFLVLKHRTKSEEELKQKATGDELLSLAYLKAMDDYQEVSQAVKYASIALEKNPNSLTYNLISALIISQKALDSDWCEVYKIFSGVRENKSLKADFKGEAAQIIYDYIDGYKEFCK